MKLSKFSLLRVAAMALAGVALLLARDTAVACPFCSAVSLTFTEEIDAGEVAVFAKLVQTPTQKEIDAANSDFNAPQPPCTFEITEVVKVDDGKSVAVGQKFKSVYLGDKPIGTEFLVTGLEAPKIVWGTPVIVNDRVKKYIHEGLKLPKEGVDRLVYFQDYLEDKDEILTRDAYDEFAKAPYKTLQAMKEKINRQQILKGVQDTKTISSRKRLYFSLLSVCGTKEDAKILEGMLKSEDREQRTGLDALIGCYLSLKGDDGMTLIEELFLQNKKSAYPDTYSAVMAIRLQGEEMKGVSKDRLKVGLRYMLDRADLADLVITDLARWQDWSVVDRLFALFKTAPEENSWIRMPVINYMRACPEAKAKEYLEEIKKLDPESVKKADIFFPLGGVGTTATPTGTPAVPDDAATSGRPPKKKPGITIPPGETAPKPAPVPKTSANPNLDERVQLGSQTPAANGVRLLDSPLHWFAVGGLGLAIFGLRRWTRRT